MLTVATFWERMFSALVQFKTEHGHCDVPAKWSENPQLGKWTNRQRTVYRRGGLSPDRVERLEALGFEWDAIAARWENRRSELVRFKTEHGHCDVPRAWSKNPVLGNWVGTQRSRAKKGRMTDERRSRLEEIGFRF